MADRILRHLDEDRVAGAERLFDALRLAVHPQGVPVHLTGVEDRVAALPDVDERGLHAGQDVLDTAHVDVPDEGGLCLVLAEVVLDGDAVFEDRELSAVRLLPDEHRPG